MKKTVFQRIIAFSFCLIFVIGCFSLNSVAADGAATNANKEGNSTTGSSEISYDTKELKELLSSIAYKDYLVENDEFNIELDKNTKIVIDATNVYEADAGAVTMPENAQSVIDANPGLGNSGYVITSGLGNVSWKVPDGTAKAFYTITINYYAINDGLSNAVERSFL